MCSPHRSSLPLSCLLPILGIAALALAPLSGADPLTPEAQRALAQSMGAKAQRFEMWTDADGNVTGLIFINHQALTKEVGEKPGIDDGDLAKLTLFPRLTALNLEAQAVGDAGLAVLKDLPQLKQIGYHYMGKNPEAAATPTSAVFLDGKPDLEILEIKHNFRMDGFDIEAITTPMPKVWRLVLDTPLTAEQTMHLVRLCPNVRDLQLHRTFVSAEQLAEIGKLLPKLEVLWWKPKGALEPGHLAALVNFPKLRIYSPQQFKNQLPYENGWDALTRVPSLERVEMSLRDDENAVALKKLREARPGLVIDPDLTRSRNYNGL